MKIELKQRMPIIDFQESHGIYNEFYHRVKQYYIYGDKIQMRAEPVNGTDEMEVLSSFEVPLHQYKSEGGSVMLKKAFWDFFDEGLDNSIWMEGDD